MSLGAHPAARPAMLNAMADVDIERSIVRQAGWGIRDLDLKDALFGKDSLAIDDGEAERIRALASAHGMDIHCLSTHLCGGDVELGERAFRAAVEPGLRRARALVPLLRPRLVRLLAARCSSPRRAGENRIEELDRRHPWLAPLYAECVDRLAEASVGVVIENEVGGCILSTADEVVSLFARIARPAARFTYDAQNLWQEGTPPTLAVYERLRPLIGYLHLKGGIHADGSAALAWSSGLAEASWPVAEMVRRAAADGVSPVICLNPSHGARLNGYDYAGVVARDLAFLKDALSPSRAASG
jgi:sugar phosphate isomerase/epimerase